VIEQGRSPCFAQEAGFVLFALEQVGRQEFQCDRTPELQILGFIDYTHAAFTELLDDAIARNSLADHG
jgi:hypothetical protein